MPEKPHSGFALAAWITLGYTLLVILWGAYVRIDGAGSGCGDNWPLCDGQLLPHAPGLKMLIEFMHRASSGLDGLAVLALLMVAWRLYPKRHRVRRAAGAAMVFMVLEALLGAALVLFGWVGTNASAARVTADGLHLVNTMLLVASVLLTALFASGVRVDGDRPSGRTVVMLGAGMVALLATAVCGTTAALADTLYPATTLAAGMKLDFTHGAPALLRIRVIHPAVAVLTGLYLLWLVVDGLPPSTSLSIGAGPHAASPRDPLNARPGRGPLEPQSGPRVLSRRMRAAVGAVVLVQWGLGVLDLLRLTPTALQLLHLLGADVLWMVLVTWAVSWFAASRGREKAADAGLAEQ